jgi:hypothetical protein
MCLSPCISAFPTSESASAATRSVRQPPPITHRTFSSSAPPSPSMSRRLRLFLPLPRHARHPAASSSAPAPQPPPPPLRRAPARSRHTSSSAPSRWGGRLCCAEVDGGKIGGPSHLPRLRAGSGALRCGRRAPSLVEVHATAHVHEGDDVETPGHIVRSSMLFVGTPS